MVGSAFFLPPEFGYALSGNDWSGSVLNHDVDSDPCTINYSYKNTVPTVPTKVHTARIWTFVQSMFFSRKLSSGDSQQQQVPTFRGVAVLWIRILNYSSDPDPTSWFQFVVNKIVWNLLSSHWLLTILLYKDKNSQVPVDFKNLFFKIKIYFAVLFKIFCFASFLRN